jgi:hypothetical protein
MEMADNQIKRSPFYQGVVSLPSQYFDDAHARSREEAAGKTLAARFAATFPADIVSLEMGPPIVDPEAPLPATSVPTVFIDHISQVSGPSYLSARPRGVFVGLALIFEATFRLPDDPSKALHFKLPTWRNPDAKIDKGDAPLEAAVYEAMMTSGFGQFTSKYLGTFFAKPDLPSPGGDTKPASVSTDPKPAE